MVNVALMVVNALKSASDLVNAVPDLVNGAYAVSDLVKSASDLMNCGENLPNSDESV